MPVSLQIFAKAAKEAGISTTGTTKELFKLMEKGLVPAVKIMPYVSKGFKEFANNNNALETMLSKLGKRFDIAKDSLVGFQSQLFESGFNDGLMYLVNGFEDLMLSGSIFAKFLGGAFKGAILTATAPFRLLYAGIYDVVNAITKDWEPATKKIVENIASITGGMVGFIATIYAAKKAWGLLRTVRGLGKIASNAADTALKGGKGGMGVQKVFVTNMGVGGDMSGGKGSSLKNIAKTLGTAALAVATSPVVIAAAVGAGAIAYSENSKYGRNGTERPFEQSYRYAETTKSSYISGSYNKRPSTNSYSYATQKVEITLNDPLLEAKITNKATDVADARISNSQSGVY